MHEFVKSMLIGAALVAVALGVCFGALELVDMYVEHAAYRVGYEERPADLDPIYEQLQAVIFYTGLAAWPLGVALWHFAHEPLAREPQ